MAQNGTANYAADTERLQVIGEDQRFTKDLSKSIENWGLVEKGFNYDLVAVFGSQSSGKSTLLNRVFGTTFDVMDETDRRQTTKGIWMCKGKGMDVLVMDVEGADGRERGENQDFERKAALFSMASSEVIIVNLWEHQVGLYQGANMGLLKTVFEVDLALFQANKAKQKQSSPNKSGYDKTNLFFVIRDHIGVTPLSNLEKTITGDLNRIWDGLVKPEGTENSRITDYFDLTFTTLSHKILQPENFDRGVEDLRQRFVEKSHPDYVFKPIYHKRIPADGLAQYMSGIWDAVVTNKDLDLPTQQELLAQFRCDEIAASSFSQFSGLLIPVKTEMEAGSVIVDLGKKMEFARATSLASFDLAASRYHSGVYKRKKIELLGKMNSTLEPTFLAQLKNLSKSIIKTFKANLLSSLKNGPSATSAHHNFGEIVEGEKNKAVADFEDGAGSLVLKDTDWSYSESLYHLQEELSAISNQCKLEEMKKITSLIEKNLKREINELVEINLAKHTPKMWDMVLDSFESAIQKSTKVYLEKTQSFSHTEDEKAKTLSLITKKAWIALRQKIDEQTADATLLVKLKLAFEERFRYDSDGVPKVWKLEDDIDGAFRIAKDETLALVSLYGNIKPSDSSLSSCIPTSSSDVEDSDVADFDFDSTTLILSASKQNELSNRFKKECDAYYLEAKRSLVSSISQIPYWMYAVIGVLGWNEFLAVIRSPLYFATLLILAGTTYLVFKMDMQGPALAIGRGLYNETSRVAKEKLSEYITDPKSSQSPQQLNSTRISGQSKSLLPRGNMVKEEKVENVELQEL